MRDLRPGSKKALLVARLYQPGGAFLTQLISDGSRTASAPALTGLRKGGYGVTRTRNEAGETVYRAEPRKTERGSRRISRGGAA
jgi:hypothetical protein